MQQMDSRFHGERWKRAQRPSPIRTGARTRPASKKAKRLQVKLTGVRVHGVIDYYNNNDASIRVYSQGESPMNRRIQALLVVGLLLGLTTAADAVTRGGKMVYARYADSLFLDPVLNDANVDIWVLTNLYDTLLQPTP